MPEQVDRSYLLSLLDRLETHWRDQGATIGQSLADGLPNSAFDREATGLPFELPAELRIWWGWHNGLRPEVLRRGYSPGSIGPGGYWFLTLDEAIAEYNGDREIHTREQAEDMGAPDMYWHESWMPFLTMEAQRLYMDCAGLARDQVTPVRLVSHEWEDFLADRAPSLTAAVERWVEAFDRGFYRWSAAESRWEVRYQDLPDGWRGSGLF